MLKYYLLVIEEHKCAAIINIESYYKDIFDYTNMKKYYIIAIKYDNVYYIWAINWYIIRIID